MAKNNKDTTFKLEISQKELQEFIETLDPKRNIQDLAASAAEIIASAGFSTHWDDILPMLDDELISEDLRLAAHIIFRAKLVLEEMEKDSSLRNIVYNTMLMMDALGVANIKGYIPSASEVNFNKMEAKTSSMNIAIKKEDSWQKKIRKKVSPGLEKEHLLCSVLKHRKDTVTGKS